MTDVAIVHRLLRGEAGSPGAIAGRVRHLHSDRDLLDVASGDVVVCASPAAELVAQLGEVAAVVSEGGAARNTGLLALRQRRIPAVVSLTGAFSLLAPGQEVVVDGTRGVIWFNGVLVPTGEALK